MDIKRRFKNKIHSKYEMKRNTKPRHVKSIDPTTPSTEQKQKKKGDPKLEVATRKWREWIRGFEEGKGNPHLRYN